ncbi:MAG: hypothetical protein HY517_02810 [Candidatus Aenigmarchaeota archaeon]|nr:hypothetical protein [Candidatus Aenigmarchaeota archaeon]
MKKTKAVIGATMLTASLFNPAVADAQQGQAVQRAAPPMRRPPQGALGYAVPRDSITNEIIVTDRIPPQMLGGRFLGRRFFADRYFFRDPFYGLFFGYVNDGRFFPRYSFDCDFGVDYLTARFIAQGNISRYGPTIGDLRGRWRLNAFDRWYRAEDEPSVRTGNKSPVNINGTQTTTYNEGLSREDVAGIVSDAIRDAERRGYERGIAELPAEPVQEEERRITVGYDFEICNEVQYTSEAVNILNNVFAEVEEDTGVNLHAYVAGSLQNPYILIRGPNDRLYFPNIDLLSQFHGRKPGGSELVDYLDRNVLQPMKIDVQRDYPEIKFQFRSPSCRGF